MAGQADIMNQLLGQTPTLKAPERSESDSRGAVTQTESPFVQALMSSQAAHQEGRADHTTPTSLFDGAELDQNPLFTTESELSPNQPNQPTSTETQSLADQLRTLGESRHEASDSLGLNTRSSQPTTLYSREQAQAEKRLSSSREYIDSLPHTRAETKGQPAPTEISSTRQADEKYRAQQQARLAQTRAEIRAAYAAQNHPTAQSGTLQTLELHTDSRQSFSLTDIPLLGDIAAYLKRAQQANKSLAQFHTARQNAKKGARGLEAMSQGPRKADMMSEMSGQGPERTSTPDREGIMNELSGSFGE